MTEAWFGLSTTDQEDALAAAADRSGRPAHLLEKDIYVVWALAQLGALPEAGFLRFKGGTSLSKVYHAIDRFSEDIDLTFDIRHLAPDLGQRHGTDLPQTRSQADTWRKEVTRRLTDWVAETLLPRLTEALNHDRISGQCRAIGTELHVEYDPRTHGSGYITPVIRLEFGGLSTGEPYATHPIVCDAAEHLPTLHFPSARIGVLAIERTFWEKATAIHAYCHRRPRSAERFARHWYDLVCLWTGGHAHQAVNNRSLARQVADHKGVFYREKTPTGDTIDYREAVDGKIQLVPTAQGLTALETDYAGMREDGLLPVNAPDFRTLIDTCHSLQDAINHAS